MPRRLVPGNLKTRKGRFRYMVEEPSNGSYIYPLLPAVVVGIRMLRARRYNKANRPTGRPLFTENPRRLKFSETASRHQRMHRAELGGIIWILAANSCPYT